MDPEYLEMAKEDPDFNPIREREEFRSVDRR
jgi:hypothetical protein